MIDNKKISKKDQQTIIRRVMGLEQEWDSYEAENVRESMEDAACENGEMWTPEMKADRQGRVQVTVNKLTAPVKRISNEFRQNAIGIKVTPQETGDKANARIRQGLIRNIEKISNATVTYSSCFDQAVKSGFGFFRVLADYKDNLSFDQDLKIEIINNNLAVKMDFRRKWAWGHDAKWCIINDMLSREDVNNQFPDSDLAKMGSTKESKYPVEWLSQSDVKVAEFFEINYKPDMVYQLQDGSTIFGSKYKIEEHGPIAIDATGKQISRKTTMPYVNWYKLTCTEILECSELPIQYIPVICMPGEIAWVGQKRYFRSLIRFAKKLNQYYNIHKSNEIEKDSLGPKAPFIVTVQQIKGFEELWRQANTVNLPYLLINETASARPERVGYVNNSAGETRLAMEAAEDIKSVTGVYDPALGQKSNEISGVAIRARSGQSQTINYNFHDNAAIAVQYCGLIINDWLPSIYDGERTVRILGAGEKEEVVKLNSQNPNEPFITFDNDVEKYDVNVSTGPAYATQMQEAFATITELLPSMNPQQKDLSLEIAVKNLTFPDSDVMSSRFAKLNKKMYGDILADEVGESNQNEESPEALKATIDQANQALDEQGNVLNQYAQMLEQMQAQLQTIQDKEAKALKLEEMRHENAMEEAKFKADVEFKLQEMKANADFDKALLADQIAKANVVAMPQGSAMPVYAEQDLQQEYQENDMMNQESPEMGAQMQEQEQPEQMSMEFEDSENVLAQTPGIESPEMEQ